MESSSEQVFSAEKILLNGVKIETVSIHSEKAGHVQSIVLVAIPSGNSIVKKMKRTVMISDLHGITLSMHNESNEFVIHIANDQDYRIKAEKRREICDAIKVTYAQDQEHNLPVYGVRQKHLNEYTTNEKDTLKGISRIPLNLARIREEDVIKGVSQEEEEKLGFRKHSSAVSINSEMSDIMMNMKHREQAFDKQKIISEDFDQEMDDQLLNPKTREKSHSLYYMNSENENIQLEDFELVSIIGRGNFGKVYMVYLPSQKMYFAMKSIRKDIVIENDSLESIYLEKLILLQVNHPFIVKMHFVFQRSYRIYFIMDYIKGGDMFQYLREERRFSEERTCFYAAQIALALGYLHKSRILYRDLKPENLLLDESGYLRLADFGLAKQARESNSFCGTPEYLSPEMIVGTGHDHTLDWWALGILIYEMLIGIPPFYDKNRNKMFLNIEKAPIRWPDQAKHGISVSSVAQDLIMKLLERDRKKRLGQQGDVDEVLAHAFFARIDIEQLKQMTLPAPYMPKVPDLEQVKANANVVSFKDLHETDIPNPKKDLVNQKSGDFDIFGDFNKQFHQQK